MKSTVYSLEFLMPCFCAGADQGRAEVRASSIRGQLRWWFRALGGSSAEEREVFGGVAGTASSSSLNVRIKDSHILPWSPPQSLDIGSNSYVYHFARVSGTEGKGADGPRWNSAGAIGPRSTFKLELLQRRPVSPPLQARLDLAVRCFLQLGTIGLRATRGLGSFVCHEQPFTDAIVSEIRECGFRAELRDEPPVSYDEIAKLIGRLVKGTRKSSGWKIDTMSKRPISTPSPFGSSSPRQTSAVYFRPVRRRREAATCELVVFEAPQHRVLGDESRKPSVVGHAQSRLVKADPVSSPRRR
jgi:CRISPR type III-B/RAMP module RAMP protein Cmr1